jgi:hypothetical protein
MRFPYSSNMNAVLPSLKEMALPAKLQVMEELWNDLCHLSGGIESPAWHGGVLTARSNRVAEGTAKFHDWEDVKDQRSGFGMSIPD